MGEKDFDLPSLPMLKGDKTKSRLSLKNSWRQGRVLSATISFWFSCSGARVSSVYCHPPAISLRPGNCEKRTEQIIKMWWDYHCPISKKRIFASQIYSQLFSVLKVRWSTCNLKYFDVNCCELKTLNFRCNLSENLILICNNVVGNIRAFLLSSNVQRKNGN